MLLSLHILFEIEHLDLVTFLFIVLYGCDLDIMETRCLNVEVILSGILL